MQKGMFSTWRSFTAIVLILGSVLFQVSAWMPLTALTDSKGTFVYLLPPQGLLEVVFHHQTLWWWTNALFMGSILVTILGLALLSMLLREAGDRVFSQLGLILFTFGAALWFIQLAFRLSIDLWAAREMARTGVLPNFYVPLSLWTHVLFVIYSILAFSALVLYGRSVLSSRLSPQWVGWLVIVYGLAGLGLLGFTGDAPPFLNYVMPILIGIVLLRWSKLSTRSLREEKEKMYAKSY